MTVTASNNIWIRVAEFFCKFFTIGAGIKRDRDCFYLGGKLVFNYLNAYDIDQAIKFAMQAAAITVQHRGVYAPKLEEVVHET